MAQIAYYRNGIPYLADGSVYILITDPIKEKNKGSYYSPATLYPWSSASSLYPWNKPSYSFDPMYERMHQKYGDFLSEDEVTPEEQAYADKVNAELKAIAIEAKATIESILQYNLKTEHEHKDSLEKASAELSQLRTSFKSENSAEKKTTLRGKIILAELEQKKNEIEYKQSIAKRLGTDAEYNRLLSRFPYDKGGLTLDEINNFIRIANERQASSNNYFTAADVNVSEIKKLIKFAVTNFSSLQEKEKIIETGSEKKLAQAASDLSRERNNFNTETDQDRKEISGYKVMVREMQQKNDEITYYNDVSERLMAESNKLKAFSYDSYSPNGLSESDVKKNIMASEGMSARAEGYKDKVVNLSNEYNSMVKNRKTNLKAHTDNLKEIENSLNSKLVKISDELSELRSSYKTEKNPLGRVVLKEKITSLELSQKKQEVDCYASVAKRLYSDSAYFKINAYDNRSPAGLSSSETEQSLNTAKEREDRAKEYTQKVEMLKDEYAKLPAAKIQENLDSSFREAAELIVSAGKSISEHYSEKIGQLATQLAGNVRGLVIRNYSEAMETFEKIRSNPRLMIHADDLKAIDDAFKSDSLKTLSFKLKVLAKNFKVVDYGFFVDKTIDNLRTGITKDDWKPLALQMEALILSSATGAASYTAMLAISLSLGMLFSTTLFISSGAIIFMIIVSAFFASRIDEYAAEKFNKAFE